MKISVDDQELFTISDFQKKVICNDIRESEFDEDMKRRLSYIISHKFEGCLNRLRKEWEPVLASRYDSLPTNQEAFSNLVFSQEDYKCRETRYAEEMAELEKKKSESELK